MTLLMTTPRDAQWAQVVMLGATCRSETTSPPAHGDPGVGGGRAGASRRCVGTHVSASKAVGARRGAAAAVREDIGGAI